MRKESASANYLSKYAETELPACPGAESRWQHVLIVPAYDEPVELLDTLSALRPDDGGTLLVLLVLNRPQDISSTNSNEALRTAILAHPCHELPATSLSLYPLNNRIDLCLYDMEQLRGPCSPDEGVGLARKQGCDIALHWINEGAIDSPWLNCTDADAQLPADHFSRLPDSGSPAAAVTFPFYHQAASDDVLTRASALYELRLHHYVLGLEYAGSHYAMHTLGSCMSVHATAYAQVRGVPRRNAAEDFYLLNKLAKVGQIERLTGSCIKLASRASDRVPFGTGPSLAAISQLDDPMEAQLFYDPQGYIALKAVLRCLRSALAPSWQLDFALKEHGLSPTLAETSVLAMTTLGLDKALAHCRRQSHTQEQFDSHMQQWFDGFRTLKFIHALRDNGLPLLSLAQLEATELPLWPYQATGDASLHWRISKIQQYWQWLG